MEFLCEICGKSVYLGWNASGCTIWCEGCQELNDKADEEEAKACCATCTGQEREFGVKLDRSIEADSFPQK